MRKLGKKVTLDKRSLQAYKFCVCSNCPWIDICIVLWNQLLYR